MLTFFYNWQTRETDMESVSHWGVFETPKTDFRKTTSTIVFDEKLELLKRMEKNLEKVASIVQENEHGNYIRVSRAQ